MISLSDSNYQAKITGVIVKGGFFSIAANSPEILLVMDYDLPEAERQLSIWQSRHQDDCDIVSKNPLTLSIRPTGHQESGTSKAKRGILAILIIFLVSIIVTPASAALGNAFVSGHAN